MTAGGGEGEGGGGGGGGGGHVSVGARTKNIFFSGEDGLARRRRKGGLLEGNNVDGSFDLGINVGSG